MVLRHPLRLAGAVALLFALFAPPVTAQEPGPVAWLYEIDVAVADIPAMEAAMEEWSARLEEDGETWTWNVFQSITGAPRFVIMTPFHDFADFDRGPIVSESRQEDNDEWFQENLAPYIAGARSEMMVVRPDISVTTDAMAAEPPPFWQVMEWELTSGSSEAYMALTNALSKVAAAYGGMVEEAAAAGEEPMGYNVFDMMYADGPRRMLVTFPFQEFGDMDGGDPLAFITGMVAAYGHQDAAAIDATLGKYTRQVRNNLWAHRMDLSHMPDGGM